MVRPLSNSRRVDVPNLSCRSILHDPKEYPDPHLFIPERFLTEQGQLDPNVMDPTVACFGFGRRSVE